MDEMPRSLVTPLPMALGAALAITVFLSPAVLPASGTELLLAGVLPIGFFAAGALAELLRPGHAVGIALLRVGVLHLVAIVGTVAAFLLRDAAMASALVDILALAAFALGFVAVLDLLIRYPDGRYAWRWSRLVVRAALIGALGLVALAALGSPSLPQVVALGPASPNPWFVPMLEPVAGVAGVVSLAPLVGLVLLLVRYAHASAQDRRQMRWPILTTLILVTGILTTALLEDALGAPMQAALFIAAGAALPGSFLVGLLRHSAEADRLAELEASRVRVAEAEEAERRRIERDLHDGAQQELVALLSRVELARSEAGSAATVSAELDEIADGIRRVHRDLRELARGIHPSILTDRGLPDAVASAAARLPIRVGLSVSPAVASARYPAAVEGAAYLFVLEALTNAMKHAGVDHAAVALDARDGSLEVTVLDAGRGFDPSAVAGGAGLTNMRDRLASVGGVLEVESAPGAGTRLRGTLPAVDRHG